MGLKYHEVTHSPYVFELEGISETRYKHKCSCGAGWNSIHEYDVCITRNLDFSTWDSFGKLWEFSVKKDWWNEFACEQIETITGNYSSWLDEEMINPSVFADKIYEFLKER